VISYAYSNAATDRIAEVLQERCPHIGAIRYHSVESEARALRRYESESAEKRPLADSTLPSSSTDTKQTAATQKPTGTEKTADELAMIEDEQAWFEYFTEIETKDETWKGSKLARPNFKSMDIRNNGIALGKTTSVALLSVRKYSVLVSSEDPQRPEQSAASRQCSS